MGSKRGVSADIKPQLTEVIAPDSSMAVGYAGAMEVFARCRMSGLSLVNSYLRAYGNPDELSDSGLRQRAAEVLDSEEYKKMTALAAEKSGERLSQMTHRILDIIENGLMSPLEATIKKSLADVENMSVEEMKQNLSALMTADKPTPLLSPKNILTICSAMRESRETLGLGDAARQNTVEVKIGIWNGDGRARARVPLTIQAMEWQYNEDQRQGVHLPSYEMGRASALAEIDGGGGVRCPMDKKMGGSGAMCYAARGFLGGKND